MDTPLSIAKQYFELSNKSDFAGIESLMTEATTYSSQTTGVYLGVSDILAMQRAFHAKFSSLKWHVTSVEEMKPGVVLFDYDFTGKLASGENMEASGLEYVIIYQGRIQHIKIRGKAA